MNTLGTVPVRGLFKHGAILYNEAEVFSLSITNPNGRPMHQFDWLNFSSLIVVQFAFCLHNHINAHKPKIRQNSKFQIPKIVCVHRLTKITSSEISLRSQHAEINGNRYLAGISFVILVNGEI